MKQHKYNIFHSKDPIIEYLYFLKGKVYDDRMIEVMSINPNSYNINHYYDIIISDNNDFRREEYEKCILNSFSIGFNHYCSDFISPILEKDFEKDDIVVCYGSQLTYYKPYLLEELTRLFLFHSYYINIDLSLIHI